MSRYAFSYPDIADDKAERVLLYCDDSRWLDESEIIRAGKLTADEWNRIRNSGHFRRANRTGGRVVYKLSADGRTYRGLAEMAERGRREDVEHRVRMDLLKATHDAFMAKHREAIDIGLRASGKDPMVVREQWAKEDAEKLYRDIMARKDIETGYGQ